MPSIVMEEFDAFPKPRESIICLKGAVNEGALSITAELKATKNTKHKISIQSFSFANNEMVAHAK